jgi:RNA-dependent RNA polymerase
MMKSSLQDHNIEISDRDDFIVIPGMPATIWPAIDPPRLNQTKSEVQKDPNHNTREYAVPFEVRYQLEVCISQGVMNEHNLSEGFVARLANIARKDQTKARHMLEYAAEQEKRIYDPMTIFDNVEALAYSPNSKIPHYCAYSRKVTVTPTTIYFSSPTVETTNRVIRRYTEDRFLRVQFTDEKFEVCILRLLKEKPTLTCLGTHKLMCRQDA